MRGSKLEGYFSVDSSAALRSYGFRMYRRRIMPWSPNL